MYISDCVIYSGLDLLNRDNNGTPWASLRPGRTYQYPTQYTRHSTINIGTYLLLLWPWWQSRKPHWISTEFPPCGARILSHFWLCYNSHHPSCCTWFSFPALALLISVFPLLRIPTQVHRKPPPLLVDRWNSTRLEKVYVRSASSW